MNKLADPMRSLAVKLTLLFLAVSVAGTLLASLLIRRQTERQFDRLIRQQGEALFVRDVQGYYMATGSLNGVERFLAYRHTRADRGRTPAALPFALAGTGGEIIVPAGQWRRGDIVPAGILASGLPVTVSGDEVGTVLLLNVEPIRDGLAEEYLRDFNRALLLGALGATAIAIVLGAVLANYLTQPLREVASASEALAQGELGQQVPVRTRDELGQLANSFNQMSAALAQATQQRQQMTADIAHDLRTPLTVLGGYLEAMEEGTLPPTPERLAILQQEVNGLKRLVDDLRTLSLADAGELPLSPQQVEAGLLLEQVRAAYTPQAARREIALSVAVQPGLPTVRLDPERMRQVLGNLIGNALRYTEAGGQITLSAQQERAGEQAQLLISVADSGSGIDAADLPFVFDRFYRGDKARAEGTGESGLGLAIARSLVELHGGAIAVTSTPGEGSTFLIRLPL